MRLWPNHHEIIGLESASRSRRAVDEPIFMSFRGLQAQG
jgi:hypothetical protein